MWLVAGYIVLFIIRPWERLFPVLNGLHIERAYGSLMVLATVAFRGGRLRLNGASAAVLVFLGSVALSAVTAYIPAAAWPDLYKYFTLVVFFFAVTAAVRSETDLLFLVCCYLGVMGLYLWKALWEYFVHGAHHWAMEVPRLIGIEETFGHPNSVAGSVLLSLPLVTLLFSCRRQVRESSPPFLRPWVTPALAAYTALAITALVLTRSRSGAVGFVSFLLMTAMARRGFRRKVTAMIGIVMVLGGLWAVIPGDSQERLRTMWDSEAGPENAHVSAESRWEGFLAGVEMFKRRPVTGVGVGNFIPFRVAYIDGVNLDPHNLQGQVLGELGLVGTLAFLCLVANSLYNCARTYALTRSDPRAAFLRSCARAVAFVVLLMCIDGLFGHNLYRFNWLWMCAFASLAKEFALKRRYSVNST